MKGTLQEDQYLLLSYLAHFFLEREMFETNLAEKIKTHILYLLTFSSKIMPFMRYCRDEVTGNGEGCITRS